MDDLSSRYTIKKKISSGGMATIYLAEDTALHRDVAIKRVHPHLLERSEAIKRFNNEAKIIASLSHKNIITVFDYGESKNGHYIVMEYIDGFNTLEIVEKFGTIPNLVLLDIITQILYGLKAAHDQGVYHRDIKPENIMIDKKGGVHIMDFGIAFLVNQESITLTGSFVGSPSYVSPEQVIGKKITEKSDIFSFGGLCYVSATNELPFDADNPNGIIHKVVNVDPVPPFRRNSELILELSDFILCCLQKDSEKRPDVNKCLSLIEDLCRTDTIKLDMGRYSTFINDPDKYRMQEREELYKIYQKNASTNYKNKKYVSALKNLNQIQSFGKLSKEDYKLRNRIKNRGKIKKAIISVSVIAMVLFGAFIINKNIPKEDSKTKEFSNAVPIEKVEQARELTVDKQIHLNNSAEQDSSIKTVANNQPEEKDKKQVKGVKKISVQTEKTQDNLAPISKPQYGCLNLRTNPPWAKVYIDEIFIGETPKTGIIQLKTGRHKLVIEKSGFNKENLYLSIPPNDTLHKKIKLTPLSKAKE